jgi:hypothetical protein
MVTKRANRYDYLIYSERIDSGKIRVIYPLGNVNFNRNGHLNTNPDSPFERTYTFLSKTDSADYGDDFFKQKLDLTKDRKDLILSEIRNRDRLLYENLKGLYDDLLMLDNWRLAHDPTGYIHDQTWQRHNEMELNIRQQIRREMTDSMRDTAFPEKDLRESLLEFKVQKTKSDMLGGGLEEMMGPAGSQEINRGDYSPPQPYS